ncbi:MAG TPA: alpha/beta hydrolase [Ktedonobacteraceae bacterium]|nr:alpha/beta hydrolase [Ktedonobacteraceae bacterium]
MQTPATTTPHPFIDAAPFHADVRYIESLWRRFPVGNVDMPFIDIGEGEPLVFVPILEHLEWVYARQVQAFSRSRRVILYRRQESRARFVGLAERAGELLNVLDSLGLHQVDLVGHGDAAMVLFEFAIQYPRRCRSLTIIAQAADYQIAPHPFIWLLHELFIRLPVEHILSASFLRRIVINYIMSSRRGKDELQPSPPQLPRHLIEEQFAKIAAWPAVYKFSVLPIIHNFDIRQLLHRLTMPILLINRADDALSPEVKTGWLARQLPDCAGYHVIAGGERFFMYAQSEQVNALMQTFLTSELHRSLQT